MFAPKQDHRAVSQASRRSMLMASRWKISISPSDDIGILVAEYAMRSS